MSALYFPCFNCCDIKKIVLINFRTQLTVCLVTMIKHDFPGRWTNVVEKIDVYLKSDNPTYWMAGIIGFSALVKAFEYQKADKSPIHGAVKVLLPGVYNVMTHLVSNAAAESAALQKTIVKSYFKLIQVNAFFIKLFSIFFSA